MLRTLLAALAAVVFSGICNDKRVDCSNWARDGECTGDNSRYMMEICPLSCGVCTHVCNGTDTSCGAWATAGECEANPESMLRICPTSCGLCTPECKDTNADCPGWGGSGECNENPEFMIRTCPVTCEACKSTCKDLQPDCPGWTSDGEWCAPRRASSSGRLAPCLTSRNPPAAQLQEPGLHVQDVPAQLRRVRAVSYTHLTLPTTPYV